MAGTRLLSVMVFFSPGVRILLEVMDINDAAHCVETGSTVLGPGEG